MPACPAPAMKPSIRNSKDVNPEDYPDIHKMAILADVAPYSREYHTYRQRVGKQAQGDTELEIEYERILNRVKKTRSFRPAEPKAPRARARPKQHIHDPGLVSSWHPILFKEGRARTASLRPADTKHLTRARQTKAPIHDPDHCLS